MNKSLVENKFLARTFYRRSGNKIKINLRTPADYYKFLIFIGLDGEKDKKLEIDDWASRSRVVGHNVLRYKTRR